ncbi:DNA repair and recombination protein RAD54B isoform X3 [Marmota marmota marmota]|uniref:DNA repair and recombination protein RAD54B isoform X3 n=1 Tax=Marmota marmota marmota TaxID=9994 RepID=UPI002092E093|nr:DNA repair and recombination protein RAD54B isoform X3 [Marmota marmota marmota]
MNQSVGPHQTLNLLVPWTCHLPEMSVLLKMRRSAAPSQLQGDSLKKPKFIPPGRSNPSLNTEIIELNPDIRLFEGTANNAFLQAQNDSGVCGSNLLPTKGRSKEINDGNNYSGKCCFEASAVTTLDSPPLAPKEITESKGQEEESESLVKYFNVVWCKPSKKKHKKWEGDAILIVKGRSFTLKDLDGKDIGKDSLVMPLPDKNHQCMFNKNNFPLVEVVVDPHLVYHLRPHQKEGIIFLYEVVMGMRMNGRCGAILADEMGLGKTLQCISLIWTLQCQGPYGGKPVIKKTLIVTPGSLVNNWRKEFQKWLGSERIKVFTVDQDHKVDDFIKSTFYTVLIISYEMLLRSLDQIKNVKFDLLICDEGHRLKNSAIKTTTALISLSCEKRIILTGTPVQNDLQEFFALIDFVNPGILGTLSSYRKIYEDPIIMSREPSASEEEKKLGERRAAELTCRTGLFILRRTQEVINKYLPPKIENVVFCRPSALQIELYRKLLNSQTVRFCLQGLLENSPHLICIGALKKLCNHPCLLFNSIKEKERSSTCDENEERRLCEGLLRVFPADYNPLLFTEKESGKLQVLSKLLAVIHQLCPTEKVVLVSNYTQTLNILQEVCRRHGYAYTRLDGQTPISQRQQIVDGFNSKYSSDFIFLLSSKAGGVGLNLIGGSHLILYDIDWNPATDIQAMSRIWRDGQKHSVHIYRLLTTGTIEEKIYQRQISKQNLSGAVVDVTKTSEHIQFSVEELKNLFTLHESSLCVTHDLLGCICTRGEDQTDDSSEKIAISRHCQLGPHHQKPNSLKPLSMSQLKRWKHFSGDDINLTDPFLKGIRENVSFFFQNITITLRPCSERLLNDVPLLPL